MESKLQFDTYKILTMEYHQTLDSEEWNEEEQPNFEVNVAINKENITKAFVTIKVEIGEKGETSRYVQVEILGHFTYHAEKEESLDLETLKKLYRINGTAIMFPYLRSAVSTLTSEGFDSPIVLPTINFKSFFEQAKEVEE